MIALPVAALPDAAPLDRDRIAGAIDLLQRVTPDARLTALRNLCVNNGVWTVPDGDSEYSPVLFEVQLFGVAALADTADDLPRLWILAATATLHGLPA